MPHKYIFICGGVMSGIGKGVATASIGRILKDRGFRVTAIKIDPYINVDAGTMNPVEHGEVFVTEDGMECDQDLGNYERFLDENIPSENYMTTGAVYQSVIARERNLEYEGKCVEVVPHIPEEVIRRLERASRKAKADFVLVEIGGTVGEYQNALFLETGRIMKLRCPHDILFVLVSYLPVPDTIGEMKTKPTQHAVRSLNYAGIQPDIIIARSHTPIDEPRKRKIGIFCNVAEQDVISAPDTKFIYEIPMNFEKDRLGNRILSKFGISSKKRGTGGVWKHFVSRVRNLTDTVKIGIVGKYFGSGAYTLADSYISVIEAIKHAAWSLGKIPEISWLDAETYEKDPQAVRELASCGGIIVPGGFGVRGVEGKIRAIEFCRKNKRPFFGLCYGLQLAVVEFGRNVCVLENAHTTEVHRETPHPVIHMLPEQLTNVREKRMGGSMRLGAYACMLTPGTRSYRAYCDAKKEAQKKSVRPRARIISERHRHRFEVNNDYRDTLEKNGMIFAGINPERNLVEIIELKKHPFFVGTQFHPEFTSRPLKPHPLFQKFIRAAINASK